MPLRSTGARGATAGPDRGEYLADRRIGQERVARRGGPAAADDHVDGALGRVDHGAVAGLRRRDRPWRQQRAAVGPADRLGPLVVMLVSRDDQVNSVLVKERHPLLPD